MTDLDSVPNGESGRAAAERIKAEMQQVLKLNSAPEKYWVNKAAERVVSATPGAARVSTGTVRSLRPAEIRPSAFANREAFNWETSEFQRLKEEIGATGGNTVPILVRPVIDESAPGYEIVYGHRRHHACLLLGLDVRAEVESMDDETLMRCMILENQHRADLTPVERGRQYKSAMRIEGLNSTRKLARMIGGDHSAIAKDIILAELPTTVVNAFRSLKDIQVRWGPPLRDALEANREGVLSQAELLSTGTRSSDAKFVFEQLCGSVSGSSKGGEVRRVVADDIGKVIATVIEPGPRSKKGIVIQLEPGFWAVERLELALLACWTETVLAARNEGEAMQPGL